MSFYSWLRMKHRIFYFVNFRLQLRKDRGDRK
jgi:hypothetical protein